MPHPPRARLAAALAAVATCLGLGACGGGGSPSTAPATAAPAATPLVQWKTLAHIGRPVDLAGPRADGSVVVAAAGRLMWLSPGAVLHAFAPAYRSRSGEEPYIVLSTGARSGRCRWPRGTLYALALHAPRGVVAVAPGGGVSQLARVSAPGLLDGITLDRTGRFGHRLIVTINAGLRTTVDAIDCRGAVTTVTAHAPRVEGGIAVAPPGFGRFAGDLIAPDEKGGRILAITPQGRSLPVADSGLPHGGDIGVESEGFVPADPRADALLADRRTPGNRHPGDDVILVLPHRSLATTGVRPGDLLVASEGGALTDAIRCTAAGCSVRHVADGPRIAHGEGHIAFARVSGYY